VKVQNVPLNDLDMFSKGIELSETCGAPL